jgi:hypothetical protein
MAMQGNGIAAAIAVALCVALSGCKVTTSGLRTTHTASAAASVSPASPGAPSGSATAPSGPATAPSRSGLLKSIDRRELASLLGLSLDQARQRLKDIGHTGNVRVTRLVDDDRRCARDAVCMIQPTGGVMETGEVTLYLNGTFKIAPPPP